MTHLTPLRIVDPYEIVKQPNKVTLTEKIVQQTRRILVQPYLVKYVGLETSKIIYLRREAASDTFREYSLFITDRAKRSCLNKANTDL